MRGPWRVNDVEGYVYAEAGDDEASRKHVEVGYLGRLVAESVPKGDRRLIAAAPDLLAACEAMISAHDRENEWDANYAIGKMRDAIEKARGR